MPESTDNAADAAYELTALLDQWETYGGKLIPLGEHHIEVAKLRALAGVSLTLTEAAADLADPADFGIIALHDCAARTTRVHVHHTPCAELVYGTPDDPEPLDAGELLDRMGAHRCGQTDEPGDTSQIITVDVDGENITAAIHGPRPLDAKDQEAMAEIVRATARLQREKEREERRQRDEDARAVDAAVRAQSGTPWELILAVRDLGIRFAERITDVRQRDRANASLADRIAEQEAAEEAPAGLDQRPPEGP